MADADAPVPLCVSCKQCIQPLDTSMAHHLARCREVRIPSVVDSYDHELCKNVRAMGGACGPIGELFESKFYVPDE